MACSGGLIEKLCAIPGVRVFADAPLAYLTTFRTGGNADLLIEVHTVEAVSLVLSALEECGIEWACLGSGSNLLVADEGFRGAVVKLGSGLDYVRGLPERAHMRPFGQPQSVPDQFFPSEAPVSEGRLTNITVGAATRLTKLARLTAQVGLAGLEFACGIPGTVGGAVLCNAGAHGVSMENVVEEVQVASAGGVETVSASSLYWGYRCCQLPGRGVVTEATLVLAFAEPASVWERQQRFLQRRHETQPTGVYTFGSVFKNPPGQQAGRLLDEAGLKGMRVGGAEVSRVHANFLENRGKATTKDALSLMALMRERVLARTGVLLEPEVRLLGTRFPWETDG